MHEHQLLVGCESNWNVLPSVRGGSAGTEGEVMPELICAAPIAWPNAVAILGVCASGAATVWAIVWFAVKF